MTGVDRDQTVRIFCQRLEEVIERSGLTRSAFANAVGLDRSTLSQLLSTNNERLPRAETICAIAAIAQVSVDWLLGLTQAREPGSELVSSAPAIETGAAQPLDERLQRWYTQAAGYKIRYVPASLPDLLKTEAVIRFEFEDQLETLAGRIEQGENRLAHSRRPENDIEVCSSVQSLESFIHGTGIWADLGCSRRKEQLKRMIELIEELYPTFRWFLYDGRQRFSAPYTIFGPHRAAVFLGNMYFVFEAVEHIRALTRQFDDLVRCANVQPTDIAGFLNAGLEAL